MKFDDRVTGSFRAGRFRHELPAKLADLCDDVSKLLRASGSDAIHMARLRSTPLQSDPYLSIHTGPEEDANGNIVLRTSAQVVVDDLGHSPFPHDLENLARSLDKAFKDLHQLHCQITNLTAHATAVTSYEDGGCTSCKRNAGKWTECEMGRPGQPRSLCRWCRGWKQANNSLPPLSVLVAYHQGQRITTALVRRLTA